MSNPCDNTLYAESINVNNLEFIENFLEDKFNANVSLDDNSLDAYFESKWIFPLELMEELFNSLPDKEHIWMRCLSIEYGMFYHNLWVCDEDGWRQE